MPISVVNVTASTFFAGVSSPRTVTIPATTAGNTLVVCCLAQFDTPPTLGIKLGSTSLSKYVGSDWASDKGLNGGSQEAFALYLNSIAGGQTSVQISDSGFLGVSGYFVIYELTPCTPIASPGGQQAWVADVGGHGVTATSTTVQPAALTAGVNPVNFGILFFETVTMPTGCVSANCGVSINSVPSAINSGWSLDKALNPAPLGIEYAFGTATLAFTGSSTQPTLTTATAMQGCNTNICATFNGAGGVSGRLITFQPLTSAQNTLSGGNFQLPNGTPVANGKLLLQLTHDEQYATSKKQVVAGLKTTIALDSNGNVLGSPTLWANDALTPAGSYYIMRVFASDGTEAWTGRHTLTVASSPVPFPITSGINLTI